MKDVREFSAQLSELASFAEREDWLYQAELRLADEFSLVATTFSQANLGAEVICKDYIGGDSVLRLSARSNILRTIKSIEKSLDRLQGLKATYRLGEVVQDYFSPSNPAKTFFELEIVRRNLHLTHWIKSA